MRDLASRPEDAGGLAVMPQRHKLFVRRISPATFLSAAFFLFAAFHPAPVSGQIHQQIRICSDGDYNDEFPPFAFFKRQDGRATSETTGYSVDFVKEILSARHIVSTVDLIPWNRCLAEVEQGNYAILLDAANDAGRQKKYLVSRPYYTLQDVFFYLKSRPIGKVESASDLRRLRVCGQSGYTYTNWGLLDREIDTGARTLEQALQKLRLGRCDVVLTRLETAVNYRFTSGADRLRIEEFGWQKMPGMAPLPFHMMVSRKLPYSRTLIGILNDGIDRMFRSGEARKLELEYLGK